VPQRCRHRVRAEPRLDSQRAVKATHAVSGDSRHPRRLADPGHPLPWPIAIVVPEQQIFGPLPLREIEQVGPEVLRHLQRSLPRLCLRIRDPQELPLTGENLLRGRFLRSSAKTPIITSPLMPLMEELLRRGERKGLIRPGVDPLHLYVVMVALCYFHRSNAHTLSFLFRTDLLASNWQSEHKKLATDLLTGYLRAGRTAP
jgi:Tetracyclin repressor-like, C-terminal domain